MAKARKPEFNVCCRQEESLTPYLAFVIKTSNITIDGGEDMEVKTRKENKAVVALVKGRIDTVTATDFEKKIAEVMAGETTCLLLNCSELEYISSAGLRSMLTISKQLKPKGMAVYFSCLKGNVKDVFNISGFGSIFKIFDSEDDALKSI